MWETLDPPWQAAIEMAWEAYCAGTTPIGAVITDPDGKIVARGRNRIFDASAPDRQENVLAHAEIEALFSLKLDQETRHGSTLYTTMEPCPLCMGAFYMSSLRTLHFAARDPYAGSTNLLGTTPYLRRKPISVTAPFDRALEVALIAMLVETEISLRGEQIITSRFFEEWRRMLPQAVELGIALHHCGDLKARQGSTAADAINWLINQVQ